ncbi:MAG: phosphoglycerate kinase [Microgenomates group bacterium Gr01-1014_5]|nr:MAG: phosphoglycerate kinase [Microgenomates group bacterium Gr01-1014_5]
MKLPKLTDLKIKGKRILLRLDLDVALEDGKVAEDYRLKAAIPTIDYLLEQGSGRIVVLGHRGRPGGKVVESLSLEPVAKHLEKLMRDYLGREKFKNLEMYMMENLRFDAGESLDTARDKEEMMEYAAYLAEHGDIYVNDAFGVCHRETASVVGLPKLLPHAAGKRLTEEVEHLEKVLPSIGGSASGGEFPKRPVVMIIGGGKYDKVVFVDKLFRHADTVLVGGVLPHKIKSYCRDTDGKMCIVAAHVNRSGRDITPDSARNFAEVIKTAKTIVWNGPMGDIDNNRWEGTEIVAKAVVNSKAYKIAGGGDTIHALHKLGISDKIDFISTGGGAMLEYLAYGDLPGLLALRNR